MAGPEALFECFLIEMTNTLETEVSVLKQLPSAPKCLAFGTRAGWVAHLLCLASVPCHTGKSGSARDSQRWSIFCGSSATRKVDTVVRQTSGIALNTIASNLPCLLLCSLSSATKHSPTQRTRNWKPLLSALDRPCLNGASPGSSCSAIAHWLCCCLTHRH